MEFASQFREKEMAEIFNACAKGGTSDRLTLLRRTGNGPHEKRQKWSHIAGHARGQNARDWPRDASPTEGKLVMTWYVVADGNIGVDDLKVWTVSREPDVPGWETDSACDSYGLWKKDAEFLATAANEKERRDAEAELTHT